MNRTRTTIRITALFVTISILLYMNLKAGRDIQRIATFKLAQVRVITADSLSTAHKFDHVTKDTAAFTEEVMNDSAVIRKAVLLISLVITMLVTSEIYFLSRKAKPEENQL